MAPPRHVSARSAVPERGGDGLRSARWFGGTDLAGFIHRASLHAEGISRSALAGPAGRGHLQLLVGARQLQHALPLAGRGGEARRALAGGLPLEFPTIGLGENLMKPTATLYRVSDARMSGTAFGTVVLHVVPESAAGGPLRAIEDGDPIELDVDAGRLDVDVPGDQLAVRLARLGPFEPRYRRGYGAMFLDHVLQADEGCDFDFLRARPGEPEDTEPYGLLSGWVGGW